MSFCGALVCALVHAAGDAAIAQTATPAPAPVRVQARDSIITLNIGDRSWQRDSVTVGVALRASGASGTQRAAWHANVGVNALLGHVTVDLHNIRGRILFRVDPSVLDSIGRTTTPPAVPPRR